MKQKNKEEWGLPMTEDEVREQHKQETKENVVLIIEAIVLLALYIFVQVVFF